MFVHHSGQQYDAAAANAGGEFKTKLEQLIHKGRSSAVAVLEQVATQVPLDRVVKGARLQFGVTEVNGAPQLFVNGPDINIVNSAPVAAPDFTEGIHAHALRQFVERAGIPNATKFINTFIPMQAQRDAGGNEFWGAEMIADNLRRIWAHSDERLLLRSVNNQVRGALSDKYRRMDTRPLLEAFASAAQAIGVFPIEGHALETRVAMKAILPVIFEPVENEFIAFCLHWQNSDYGNGAHEIQMTALRLACTNRAQIEDVMRQVHLGRRLSDDVMYSQETYRLDTVRHAFSPQHIAGYLDGIREANAQSIDGFGVKAFLTKRGVLKGEQDAIIQKFNSPDVELLPPGNTMYRMSNAISWFAGTQTNAEKAFELEQTAGELLKPVKK